MTRNVTFVGANPRLLVAPSLVDAPEVVLASLQKALNPTGRSNVLLHLVVMASDEPAEAQPNCTQCSCFASTVAVSEWTRVVAISPIGEVVVGVMEHKTGVLHIKGKAAVADIVVKLARHSQNVWAAQHSGHLAVESVGSVLPGHKTHLHMDGTASHQMTTGTTGTLLGTLGTFEPAFIESACEMIQGVINELVEAGVTGRSPAAPTTVVTNIVNTHTTIVNNTIVAAAPMEMEMARSEQQHPASI